MLLDFEVIYLLSHINVNMSVVLVLIVFLIALVLVYFVVIENIQST